MSRFRGVRVGVLAALLCGVVLELSDSVSAFCSLETRWASGIVTMSYNFPISGLLLNNTNSWDSNAESVMQEWSSVLDEVRFISRGFSGAGQDAGDAMNNMLFDDNVGGDPFGNDILAITLTRASSAGVTVETDVIFNNQVDWNAYDGAIRIGPTGRPLYDFRRVALHELGHVLGLDHPDDACGQQVPSVMNSRTSDTFRLSNDDRNGLSFLYGDGNLAPTADAGQDQVGSVSIPFLLNAGGSRDSDGMIVSYIWRLGSEVVARGRVTEVTLGEGSHVIQLTVVDEKGAVDSDTVTLTATFGPIPTDPNNRAPVANAGLDFSVVVGQVVFLNGSESTDEDGSLVRFLWTEGVAILGRDPVIQYAPSPGVHEITLTVFDNNGAFATDDVVITGVNESAEPITGSGTVILPAPTVGGGPMCGAIGLMPLLGMGVLGCVGLTRRG